MRRPGASIIMEKRISLRLNLPVVSGTILASSAIERVKPIPLCPGNEKSGILRQSIAVVANRSFLFGIMFPPRASVRHVAECLIQDVKSIGRSILKWREGQGYRFENGCILLIGVFLFCLTEKINRLEYNGSENDCTGRWSAYMVTIKDVAKRASVSPSTVSRVIAGNTRISLKTRLRVQQAMEELSYVPNAIARSLARSRTRTIAFTVARQADVAFANPFFSEVMRGMSTVAQARDYNILLSISPTPEEERDKCLRLIKERRADGLIVSTSRVRDQLIETLNAEQIPFVLIGRSADTPVLSVNNDNVQAARTATIHLFEQGYERVLFLGGDRHLVVTQDRLTGYKQACFEWRRAYDEAYALEADFSIESGLAALREVSKQGISFDAVLAADDLLALGALQFAESDHRRVPDQLGVVGFNDSPLLSYVNPPLTSVKILAYELGMEAMELLLDTLEDPAKARTKKEILLPSELVVRASSLRKGMNGLT